MPPESRQRLSQPVRLARAYVVPPREFNLFADSVGQSLLGALTESQPVDWRGRTWRVGGLTQAVATDRQGTSAPDEIYGRLGFERPGSTTSVWREEDGDFAEESVPDGLASPFVIRISDLAIIFQVRGQDIQFPSFAGAFQVITRNTVYGAFRIVAGGAEMNFDQWRQTVSRVTRVHFTALPPNPNYQDRPDVERLIEGLSLDAASLDLRSSDGVNTDAELLRQFVDHTDTRGYGDTVADGERLYADGSVTRVTYQTSAGGEAQIIERQSVTETGGVVSYQSLADELLSFGSGEQE